MVGPMSPCATINFKITLVSPIRPPLCILQGVPKVQALPGELQNGYFREEIISPLTFLSTLETIIGNDNEQRVEYEFLPLKELEIGMVTEVSTSGDADDAEEEGQQTIGATDDCDLAEKDAETESCVQDNQPYAESEESEYLSSVLEEIFESSNSYESHDMNWNLLQDPAQNFYQNEVDVREIISGVDSGDDLVMSWLSGLNGVTTISDSDLDMPDVRESLSDRIPAKEELRSFILGRRTQAADSDKICHEDQRCLRPRTDHVGVENFRGQVKYMNCSAYCALLMLEVTSFQKTVLLLVNVLRVSEIHTLVHTLRLS